MRKLIVRADDLGFSEGVNYGIEKSIKDGIVRSIGLMVNMQATEHGWNLLKDNEACVGLHTNICVGKPVCDSALIPSICDENGNFKSSKVYRDAAKKGQDFVVLEEVILEIEAQYQKFFELTGEKPHYFEGHAVDSENFFTGMQIVAKNHQCDYLEISWDDTPGKFRNTAVYTSFDAIKPDYNPFESLKKAALKDYPNNGVGMMVCHPGYLDAYILRASSMTNLRPLEVEMLCSPETKQWLKENDIEIITYDEIGER